MDRFEAMRVFVATLDQGSLAGAGRRLGRSPAAVTRAIAGLEAHVGVRLLERTTRMIRLTETGERYASACRRVLLDLEEADLQAAGDRRAPRGLLSLTAPLVAGTRMLRPIVDAFLDEHPAVQARLLLLDRVVGLIEEGMDLALRIAHLPDSSLIALRVGTVRRVICAAPAYLAQHAPPHQPSDLAGHRCIALSPGPGGEVWSFAAEGEAGRPRQVHIRPRLSVNTVEAAIGSAREGHGLARLFSYQIEQDIKVGRLVIVLEPCEPPPLPVHLVAPEGRLSVAKVRAFTDFALPRLKACFAPETADAPGNAGF